MLKLLEYIKITKYGDFIVPSDIIKIIEESGVDMSNWNDHIVFSNGSVLAHSGSQLKKYMIDNSEKIISKIESLKKETNSNGNK